MSHTPTPWQFVAGWIEQVDPEGDTVACFDDLLTHDDARFIVRAVNAFEPMKEALREIAAGNLDNESPAEFYERARQIASTALAIADKEKP